MADAKVIILTHGFCLSYHIVWPRKATTTDAQQRTRQRRNDLHSKSATHSEACHNCRFQITCPRSNALSNPILLKAKSFRPRSLSDAPM